MRKQLGQLDQVVRQFYQELTYQRQINETLANVCKQLPDWEEAVKKERKRVEDAQAEAEKNATNEGGVDELNENATTTPQQEEVQQEEQAPKLDLGDKPKTDD